MQHTTNTQIVFADSEAEAKEKYLALNIKTTDPNAVLECYKAVEEEDFDLSSDFNFVGEISVSPEVMATIRQDPERAYVLYYLEN
jgi:hypothetical protein